MTGTQENQRAEERAALERERRAFDRRQAAFIAVTRQFVPSGSGVPAQQDLAELFAADSEWDAARADVERIVGEIRSGTRR
ncbi:hypothetical protein [Cupriavidus sp. WS]|uniref:hypothetical protein n=1 Tax=Cupriavidus sp. WS TaxID=1312922 RepID=UPI000365F296|nr:hypothetical protein [Cupriavidus sp. WS]